MKTVWEDVLVGLKSVQEVRRVKRKSLELALVVPDHKISYSFHVRSGAISVLIAGANEVLWAEDGAFRLCRHSRISSWSRCQCNAKDATTKIGAPLFTVYLLKKLKAE